MKLVEDIRNFPEKNVAPKRELREGDFIRYHGDLRFVYREFSSGPLMTVSLISPLSVWNHVYPSAWGSAEILNMAATFHLED
jgi:hypothetical protein